MMQRLLTKASEAALHSGKGCLLLVSWTYQLDDLAAATTCHATAVCFERIAVMHASQRTED